MTRVGTFSLFPLSLASGLRQPPPSEHLSGFRELWTWPVGHPQTSPHSPTHTYTHTCRPHCYPKKKKPCTYLCLLERPALYWHGVVDTAVRPPGSASSAGLRVPLGRRGLTASSRGHWAGSSDPTSQQHPSYLTLESQNLGGPPGNQGNLHLPCHFLVCFPPAMLATDFMAA